jgi:hypothetical protein
MSWAIIPEFRLPDEPEALTYIAAVEAADGQALEPAVKLAINAFIKGCKADGIWPAIKASCILAGARTLTGALVPLVGTAPTNVDGLFVSDDYDRKTGLVGDGSTKYLDTNRNNNADPQNSQHLAVYQTVAHTRNVTRSVIGSAPGTGSSHLITTTTIRFFRIRTTNIDAFINDTTNSTGLWGSSRSNLTGYIGRYAGTNYSFTDTSSLPLNAAIQVFARAAADFSNARLAFYSIGESLDLALLDARVTTLINAFDAAI